MAQKILFIEDDNDTRALYKDVFVEAGFTVTEAADGEAGLALAQQGGYDLILLDVMMPKMDGLTLLKTLKKDFPNVKNGPIILLTNLASDSAITSALEEGATGYLVKSDLNPGQVVERVKEILG